MSSHLIVLVLLTEYCTEREDGSRQPVLHVAALVTVGLGFFLTRHIAKQSTTIKFYPFHYFSIIIVLWCIDPSVGKDSKQTRLKPFLGSSHRINGLAL